MNDDRCYHIPTAPGQSMCTCRDRQMFLEVLIELQARRLTELESRLARHKPQVLTPFPGAARVVPEVNYTTPGGYDMLDTETFELLNTAVRAAHENGTLTTDEAQRCEQALVSHHEYDED